MDYAPASGAIQGILKSTHVAFTPDLKPKNADEEVPQAEKKTALSQASAAADTGSNRKKRANHAFVLQAVKHEEMTHDPKIPKVEKPDRDAFEEKAAKKNERIDNLQKELAVLSKMIGENIMKKDHRAPAAAPAAARRAAERVGRDHRRLRGARGVL